MRWIPGNCHHGAILPWKISPRGDPPVVPPFNQVTFPFSQVIRLTSIQGKESMAGEVFHKWTKALVYAYLIPLLHWSLGLCWLSCHSASLKMAMKLVPIATNSKTYKSESQSYLSRFPDFHMNIYELYHLVRVSSAQSFLLSTARSMHGTP